MLMTLYRVLDRSSWQFDFLEFSEDVSEYTSEIESLGGRVLKCRWSQHPVRLRRTIRELETLIVTEGPPYLAVHSHVMYASGTVLAAAARAGVSIRVAHSHSTNAGGPSIAGRAYRRVAGFLVKRYATGIAACSSDAGQHFFGPDFQARGVIVPNAVDATRFVPGSADQKSSIRQLLGLSQSSLVLVSVARFEPVKNHQFLIRLASLLSERGIDYEMLLVGDGRLREEVEGEIIARSLGARVCVLGLRADVEAILRASDMFLMPSLHEGLPVALVEAQASGVTCLVSDRVSREADLGLGLVRFLPIDDPTGWADSIESGAKVHLRPEDIARALDEQGYGPQAALERLLSLYEGEGSAA